MGGRGNSLTNEGCPIYGWGGGGEGKREERLWRTCEIRIGLGDSELPLLSADALVFSMTTMGNLKKKLVDFFSCSVWVMEIAVMLGGKKIFCQKRERENPGTLYFL